MATEEAAQSLGRRKLNELELKVFEAALRQAVPLIRRITADGIPYGKLIIPAETDTVSGRGV